MRRACRFTQPTNVDAPIRSCPPLVLEIRQLQPTACVIAQVRDAKISFDLRVDHLSGERTARPIAQPSRARRSWPAIGDLSFLLMERLQATQLITPDLAHQYLPAAHGQWRECRSLDYTAACSGVHEAFTGLALRWLTNNRTRELDPASTGERRASPPGLASRLR